MRIVSLVPSLTESLWDLGVGDQVVGVTKFCVRPPQARDRSLVVGGTKDPDLGRVRSLRPDLVVADEDENKPEHLEEMRTFAQVHVTRIETVRDAARSLADLGRLVGREHDAEAKSQRILQRESELRDVTRVFPRLNVFVPVWRKPLMTIGGRTYMGDLVAAAGGQNVFAHAARKYMETSFEEARAQQPAGVLLPTEPYRFRDHHRPEFSEAFGVPPERVLVVDGQAFTWFGVRTYDGLETLGVAMATLRSAVGS